MKWKLVVGAGLTATALLTLDISKALLAKAITAARDDYSVEFSGTALSLRCLLRILEKVTTCATESLSQVKEEFKAARLECLQNDREQYSSTVRKYLAIQEDILQRVTRGVLCDFGVPEELFERSLKEHYLDPQLAQALTPQHSVSSSGDNAPDEATFIEILHVQLSMLRDFDDHYKDITPAEYLECEFRLDDEVEATFGVTSSSLGLAKLQYAASEQARELQDGIELVRKKLIPTTRITS